MAVEALVRWQHPTKGAISPGEFIPVAESAGLVCGIGEWVLRRVCLDVASWQHDLPEGFRVHVNLSPAQLSDGHFLSLLDHWLARTGADPNRLGFEITETVILDDHDAVRTVIAGLKQRGCHVALDDFGTGYSSLAHLRSVPLDLLKIDRAFVADLEDHSRDRAIVAAVAGLAQELGVPVLAEGVETEAQLTAVRALGVDLVQGFLLARPAPGPSIERLLGITPRAARAEGSPEPLVVPCAGAAVRPLAVGAVH